MSRFARGVHIGTHVQQGDVIGYVGMTGLATGPHLHYEYLTNGVHRNPQTVQLPGAEPLHAEALQRFRDMAAPLIAGLSPQLPSALSPAAAAGVASASTALRMTSTGTAVGTTSARTATGTAAAGTATGTVAAGTGVGTTAAGAAALIAAPVGAAEPRSKATVN
jgi:hypothetical protein